MSIQGTPESAQRAEQDKAEQGAEAPAGRADNLPFLWGGNESDNGKDVRWVGEFVNLPKIVAARCETMTGADDPMQDVSAAIAEQDDVAPMQLGRYPLGGVVRHIRMQFYLRESVLQGRLHAGSIYPNAD